MNFNRSQLGRRWCFRRSSRQGVVVGGPRLRSGQLHVIVRVGVRRAYRHLAMVQVPVFVRGRRQILAHHHALCLFPNHGRNRMRSSKELLQTIFPSRVALSTKEVAMVLFGRTDRSAMNTIRDLPQQGLLLPNLSKVRNRWLIPVAALGRALDDLQAEQLRPIIRPAAAPPGRWSWRAPPAARLAKGYREDKAGAGSVKAVRPRCAPQSASCEQPGIYGSIVRAPVAATASRAQ